MKGSATVRNAISWLLKILGVGCIVFGIYLPIRIYSGRDADFYRGFPEYYQMMVANAFFIPVLVGVILLGVSAIMDIYARFAQLADHLGLQNKTPEQPAKISETPVVNQNKESTKTEGRILTAEEHIEGRKERLKSDNPL